MEDRRFGRRQSRCPTSFQFWEKWGFSFDPFQMRSGFWQWLNLNFSANSAAFPLRTLRLRLLRWPEIKRKLAARARRNSVESAEKIKFSHYQDFRAVGTCYSEC
jgi:hypothetical protein